MADVTSGKSQDKHADRTIGESIRYQSVEWQWQGKVLAWLGKVLARESTSLAWENDCRESTSLDTRII